MLPAASHSILNVSKKARCLCVHCIYDCGQKIEGGKKEDEEVVVVEDLEPTPKTMIVTLVVTADFDRCVRVYM